ncbi:MAG: Fe-S cluster assembly transcriptional regulator IscR [Proteobacteria bacterium SW_6_67_9]|nr:MAG: Fe-S cluster assembly transcriptional regulator IscR [Proteobacteria bacterium SW_6_67_9]
MLDLALHEHRGPVPLGDIAARQDISLSYLEQLFAKLRRAGLVTSARGPGGGYRLNGAAADVSVAQVIDAVDENVEYTRCGGERNCQRQQRCLTHDFWASLSDHVRRFLEEATLASLTERPGIRAVAARQDGEPVHWGDPRARIPEKGEA